MASFIFCVTPVRSLADSMLAIAHELAERGHRVGFVGLADARPLVAPHGFPFTPFFEHLFPAGSMLPPHPVAPPDGRVAALRARLAALRANRRWVRAFWDRVETLLREDGAEVARLLTDQRPDLLLIEGTTLEAPYWASMAHRFQVPAAYRSTFITHEARPGVPPAWSSLLPGDSPLARLRSAAAWWSYRARRRLRFRLAATLGLAPNGFALAARLATLSGCPRSHLEYRTLVIPKLPLPELVPCPPELDFPGARRPGRHYLGAVFARDEPAAALPWLDPADPRPLIYCALGSLPTLSYPLRLRLLRSVVAALAARSDRRLVLALGGQLPPEALEPLPGNVWLLSWAPQTQVLARASLMITHGGLNSVAQCLHFGVPMLVFPDGFDRPGNAARVVYHGYGLAGDVRRVTPARLLSLIAAIEADPGYAARCRAVAACQGEIPGARRAADLLESLAPARAASWAGPHAGTDRPAPLEPAARTG